MPIIHVIPIASPPSPLPPFLSPSGRPQLGPRCAADRTYSLRFLKLLITEAERGARGEVWEELYPLYVDALGAGGGREKGGEGEEGGKGENGEEGEDGEEAEEGEPGHAYVSRVFFNMCPVFSSTLLLVFQPLECSKTNLPSFPRSFNTSPSRLCFHLAPSTCHPSHRPPLLPSPPLNTPRCARHTPSPSPHTKAGGTPWCYHTYAFRLPPLSSCPPYPRLHASPSRCHANSYLDSSSHALTVRVSRDMLKGGTGCTAWPASLFLAEALLSHPALLLPSSHRPSTHSPLPPIPTSSDSTPAAAANGASVGASEGPVSAPVCEEARSLRGPVCLELGAGCGLLGLCLALLPLAKLILTDASTTSLANLCTNLATNGLPFSSGPEIPLTRPSHPHGSKRTARPGQGAQLWALREEQRGRREEACEVTWSEGVSGMQECEGVRGGGRAGGEGGARVHVQQLCWEEVTPALASSLSADVIIGADIVYDPSVVPALADTLAALLSMSAHSARTEHTTWQDNHPAGVAQADATQDTGIPEHATSSLPISLPPAPYALIASTHRNPLTMACFLQALHDRGLQVRDVAEELLPHSRSRALSRWFHCLELPEADRMMLHLIHM
ncbi:unnamed protein product [Closterium sp. NIES-53]